MSPEEFWHGPVELCGAYRKAWETRRDNAFAAEWRQGSYFLAALRAGLDESLNGGKGGAQYPDAPLWSSEGIRAEIAERREREAIEAQKTRLDVWAARVNRSFDRAAALGDGGGEGERDRLR